ncbi:MAG TPA: hypothetical protein VME45_16740 [Stellaceae bacterium]|nr:hypothetical protein [Stellaceae bacterium]
MPKKPGKSDPSSLRAERADLVGHVAAAKARITDLLLAGQETGSERTTIAGLTARIAEIDNALLRQVERQHGDDIVAIDRETQRIVADFLSAFDALRDALTPPEPLHV